MRGARCLRCGAGSEWIEGRVPDEPPAVGAGNAVVDAVIRAAAIDEVLPVEGTDALIIVWQANAAEQIEAALDEAGWVLVKKSPE